MFSKMLCNMSRYFICVSYFRYVFRHSSLTTNTAVDINTRTTYYFYINKKYVFSTITKSRLSDMISYCRSVQSGIVYNDRFQWSIRTNYDVHTLFIQNTASNYYIHLYIKIIKRLLFILLF